MLAVSRTSVGGNAVAASKDAGRMVDAALHSMGRCMGLSPRSRVTPGASSPGADTQATQAPPPSRREQLWKAPASEAASSRELDAAAGLPLPGRPLLQEACIAVFCACSP